MPIFTKPNLAKTSRAKPITLNEVAKVQSRFAKNHDGKVPKGGWVAHLQRVAQRNADFSNSNCD